MRLKVSVLQEIYSVREILISLKFAFSVHFCVMHVYDCKILCTEFEFMSCTVHHALIVSVSSNEAGAYFCMFLTALLVIL